MALNEVGIVLTTHRDHGSWSLQAVTYGFGNRGLSDTGRPREQQDHTLFGVDPFVLSDELKNSLLRRFHAVVGAVEHVLRVVDIPEGINGLVPREPEHLGEVLHLPVGVLLALRIKGVDLLLKNLPGRLVHVDDGIQLGLELLPVRFLGVFKHSLVSMLKQFGLGPLLELVCCLLDVEQLPVDDAEELVVIADHLSGAVDGVLDLEEVGDKGAHALVVFREDSLEHREVVLGHLVGDLVENISEHHLTIVFVQLELRGDKAASHHIVPVKNFLREDGQNLVDLGIEVDPFALELINLAQEEGLLRFIFSSKHYRQSAIIFEGSRPTEVGVGVKLSDLESAVGQTLDEGDVVLLHNRDLNTDGS
mmetsp:Transcript_39260/g.59911  ORF Transcript_39260/g.59911 Transcript_39260/m.59911 type:complete len:363 (-) Transcript_39260:598-1686(-)